MGALQLIAASAARTPTQSPVFAARVAPSRRRSLVARLAGEVRIRDEALARYASLTNASRHLAESLDLGTTLQNVVRLLVPHLADACALDLLEDDGELHRMAAAHVDPQRERLLTDLLGRHPPDRMTGAHPVARVLRTGRSQLRTDVTAADRARLTGTRDTLPAALLRDLVSYMVVPLVVRGRAIGAVTFASESRARRFTSADVRHARDFAACAGLALENARIYRRARAAQQRAEVERDRTERLRLLADALSAASTAEDAASRALEHGMSALGASSMSVSRISDDGQALETLDASGASRVLRGRRFPADLPAATCEAARTRRAVFVEDPARRTASHPHLRLLPEEQGTGAFAAVPLCIEDRVVGVIGLTFARPRLFEESDCAFLGALGRHCALAFERTRLLSEARAAVRARDEALALVSHDLRNPLYAIKMAADMLLRARGQRPQAVSPPERRDADRLARAVLRAATRMERLVGDLLDATKIESGRLTLDVAPCDVASLLSEAYEMLADRARARAVEMTVDALVQPCILRCDRDRVLQVLGNLLGNAVKFTGPGGRVHLHASSVPGGVTFSVEDTGAGIAREHLAHVFDRHWQAPSTARLGSGLGLAIAQGIVAEHGGTIEVHSELGVGTRFRFTLPVEVTPPA